jgi:hypothetical protein
LSFPDGLASPMVTGRPAMARRTPGCCCQAGAFADEAPLAYFAEFQGRRNTMRHPRMALYPKARAGTQQREGFPVCDRGVPQASPRRAGHPLWDRTSPLRGAGGP